MQLKIKQFPGGHIWTEKSEGPLEIAIKENII